MLKYRPLTMDVQQYSSFLGYKPLQKPHKLYI